MNTTYATDETASVLSAMTAARIRVDWPLTEINPAPVFAHAMEKCVRLMSLDHDAFYGSARNFVTQDRGFAITTFPTRSGPPL